MKSLFIALSFLVYALVLLTSSITCQDDPFSIYEGREICLLNWGSQQSSRGAKSTLAYLNADVMGDTLQLAPNIDGIYTGTHWKVIRNGNNDYSLLNLASTLPGMNQDNRYLDAAVFSSATVRGLVFLSPRIDGIYVGTHWKAIKDGNEFVFYNLASDRPESYKKGLVLDGDVVSQGSVYMSGQYDRNVYYGAFWKVGLVNLNQTEVRRTVQLNFQNLTTETFDIFCELQGTICNFQTFFDSSIIKAIPSDDSNALVNSDTLAKFVKSAFSKWFKSETQMDITKRSCIGVLWTRLKSNPTQFKAFNFFLTPFMEVRIFDASTREFQSPTSLLLKYDVLKAWI